MASSCLEEKLEKLKLQEPWQTVANRKRDCIMAAIPKTWHIRVPTAEEQRDVTGAYIHQFLTSREVLLTETDVVGLMEKLSTGKWKSREVTQAFCHRACLAHQLTNCLHDVFFETALEEADRCDLYFAEHKKPMGPLHGLPVSMKDQFHIKGTDSTLGYTGWIGTFEGREMTDEKKDFESLIVTELRNLGVVLYCKTSVPQTLMAGETVNNIIGYTFNPKNRLLTAGGSSGGEGALIGLRGSPAGFGSDIGGSVRVPAGFNGIYGLRPSNGRLPYRGVPSSMDGQTSIPCVIGPLATTARSLKFMFREVLNAEPWQHDPEVINMPWRDSQAQEMVDYALGSGSQGRLSFGIFMDDGIVRPDPPVRRAMKMVVDALEKAGHSIVKWSPPSHGRGWDIAVSAPSKHLFHLILMENKFKTWQFDGGKDVHSDFSLSGEPIAPQLSRVFGKEPVEEKPASFLFATNVEIQKYRRDYLDYWNSTTSKTGTGRPVDAFISPLAPFSAARPGKYSYYTYTTVINCLDYTAVALPVTTVDQEVDVVDESYSPWNELDAAVHEDFKYPLISTNW